ncbi:unnamed protein product, partial [Polarella glacialis]
DGGLRSIAELRRQYAGYYSEEEILRYWQETCSSPPGPPAEVEAAPELKPLPAEVEVRMDEEGWCIALLSCPVPLPPDEDPQRATARLLLGGRALGAALDSVRQSVPGLQCQVDLSTLQAQLVLRESAFLIAGRSSTENKDELKLEKKLREISALRSRQCAGEALDKLQAEKVAKRGTLFGQVAGLKLRRAWEELGIALARHLPRLQGSCSEGDWPAPPSYCDASTASGGSTPLLLGTAEEADLSPSVPSASSSGGPLCRHFVSGRCAYGDSCRLSHGAPLAAAAPRRQTPSEQLQDARRAPRSSQRSLPAHEVECMICFENVGKKKERLGMLESCDHAFCLSCIRGWRREKEQQDRQNLRLCPVCRNESFFVIPCDTLLLDSDEKRSAIEQYKKEMCRIPCKMFDYGRGNCPFGSSCFYAHLNPDGTRHCPAPLKWMAGAEGSEVKGSVKLCDFFG